MIKILSLLFLVSAGNSFAEVIKTKVVMLPGPTSYYPYPALSTASGDTIRMVSFLNASELMKYPNHEVIIDARIGKATCPSENDEVDYYLSRCYSKRLQCLKKIEVRLDKNVPERSMVHGDLSYSQMAKLYSSEGSRDVFLPDVINGYEAFAMFDSANWRPVFHLDADLTTQSEVSLIKNLRGMKLDWSHVDATSRCIYTQTND